MEHGIQGAIHGAIGSGIQSGIETKSNLRQQALVYSKKRA